MSLRLTREQTGRVLAALAKITGRGSTSEWRALEWKIFDAQTRPLETRFARKALRAFVALGNTAAERIRAGAGVNEIIATVEPLSLALFQRIAEEELPRILRSGWTRANGQIARAERPKRSAVDLIQKQAPFDLGFPEVAAYLLFRPRQYSPIVTNTTINRLRSILIDLFNRGEGIEPMAREIAQRTTEIGRARARVIARTEIVSSSNMAATAAYRASNVVRARVWISTRDGRTRDTHRTVDGQQQPMDQPFIVGGSRMMHPGDTSLGAPAREWIQCRCATGPVVARLPGL